MLAEQYAELAELAGGFIHEIKNHLSTLGLNLQLLAEDFQEAETQRERRAAERIQRLQSECHRLVVVSNDFLRFARIQHLKIAPTSLAPVVEEMSDFFGPTAKQANIEIKAYIPSDLPPVPLDRELFKQALLNLMLNAEQAMPAGGQFTIQASRDGDNVMMSLIDTGQGMTPEITAEVFRPFFSTKPGGSGLGLPTVRKIVESHGGRIAVQSELGHGTKIHPVAANADAALSPGELVAMEPLANINGEPIPLAQAKVSALDRGFLFGDAVYEVLRIYRGRPWLADEHFRRLEHSLHAIRVPDINIPRLRQRMMETIAAGPFQEATAYIQISRGAAPRSHPFPVNAAPLEFMFVQEFRDPYVEARKTGASVITFPDIRWERCDIKSTNLLANVMAMQAAKEAGCVEALLYLPDGTLTEGSHSSFFGVLDGAVVTAPNSNAILPGITRGLILGLAERADIPVREHVLQKGDLNRVSELFLTGTTTEVLPLTEVDGRLIGSGMPGPITRRLEQQYQHAVTELIGRRAHASA